MDWFSQNWVWVLFAIGMVAMHMFGHGGHGGHGGLGGHGGHSGKARDDPKPAGRNDEKRSSEQGSGHQH